MIYLLHKKGARSKQHLIKAVQFAPSHCNGAVAATVAASSGLQLFDRYYTIFIPSRRCRRGLMQNIPANAPKKTLSALAAVQRT